MPEPGIEPGTSCTQSECVTTATASQLKVSIVLKLLTVSTQRVDTYINKAELEGHTLSTNLFLCNIVVILACISMFGSFSYIYGSWFPCLNIVKCKILTYSRAFFLLLSTVHRTCLERCLIYCVLFIAYFKKWKNFNYIFKEYFCFNQFLSLYIIK